MLLQHSQPSVAMKAEYSKRAVADLHRIAAYHQKSANPQLVQQIAAALQVRIARILQAPEAGRPVAQRPGVRVALLIRYRYRIFYRVTADTIQIIHIRHMARRPWPPG